MLQKEFLRTSLRFIVETTRRCLKPKKYKSIKFLCDYLGDDVIMNEKARLIQNKKVSHICTIHSKYFPGKNACLVYTNPVYGIGDLTNDAKSAIQRGSMVLITDKSFPEYPCIISKDPIKAYSMICRYYRELQPKVIITAVTGSIGKTTTKNMIGEVYKTKYKTVYTEENTNTKTTIGFAVQHIPDWAEMMVQEVHEGEPNETQWISQMLLPDVVVLTTIDNSHYQFFGNTEKIIEECCSVTEYMSKSGIVIVNKDEFDRYDLLNHRKTITVSTNSTDADFYASSIEVNNDGLAFIVHINNTGERVRVKLNNIYARHNVICAVYAFAAGYCQGLSIDAIVKGLSRYRTSGIRQNVIKTVDGIVLYIDCYNAVAKSMKSAIEACDEIPVCGKRIAVLGDIAEVGDLSEGMHRDVISYVNDSKFDVLFIMGAELKKAIECTPIRNSLQVLMFEDRDALAKRLSQIASRGDLILFKASHASSLGECIIKAWPNLEPTLSNTKRFKNFREICSLIH